jgi:hypothetical protein
MLLSSGEHSVFSRVMLFVPGFILLPENRVRALLCCSVFSATGFRESFVFLLTPRAFVGPTVHFSVSHVVYTLLLSSRSCFRCYRVLYSSKPICCCCCEHNCTVSATSDRLSRSRASVLPTNTKLPSICPPFVFRLSCFYHDNPPDFYVGFLPFSQTVNFAQESPTATS